MRKTYKYRIYPTSKQERGLSARLETCRRLYNKFVSERKDSWEQYQKGLGLYDQLNQLPTLKKDWPGLKDVYSHVLQNVGVRVDLAYQAFFRRIKAGEPNPGYPRFKSYGRYDSITYPLYGRGIKIIDTRIRVTGIGHVKMILHRPLEGTPKTATIKRSSTGKWYVSFSCEVEKKEPLPVNENRVGIDVGLETFAYFSDKNKIENPRFFKHEEKSLAKASRKLDRLTTKDKNGKVLNGTSKPRLAAKKVVSRTHERIKWRRENFAHQEARKIVNKYQVIAIEDLSVNQMIQKIDSKQLRKSIADVAWTSFFEKLTCKAEEAGRTVIAVNPAYTSQDCSGCGYREAKTLAVRVHECKECGLVLHRDLNASINILRLGLQSLGLSGIVRDSA